MSGFTTFNAAGFGATTANVAFNYDPLYTSSVPTQNISSGTTATNFIPGSLSFNGAGDLKLANPAAPNSLFAWGVSPQYARPLATLVGDFTIECWVRPTSYATQLLFAAGDSSLLQNSSWILFLSSDGTVVWQHNTANQLISNRLYTANVFSHIAYVRSGTTGTMYINGVAAGSWNDTTVYQYMNTLYLGANLGGNFYLNGLLSQPRISASAVYTANFVPLANLGVLPTTILYMPIFSSADALSDVASGQRAILHSGTQPVYSSDSPASSVSNGVFFPTTTSNIATANSSAFRFGTGNFTVEYWVSANIVPATNQGFAMISGTGNVLRDVTNQTSGNVGWGIQNLSNSTVATFTNLYSASPNAWNHVAWGKSGSNMTLWINGQQRASTVYSANVIGNNFSFNRNGPGANVSLGPIRISNSAVYTTGTNFSPPTTYTNTANTVFLLQGGANLSQYLTDQSVNNITVSAFGNTVSGSAPINYGISGNVIGDISGARNTGLVLRASGTGNTTGVVFDNNYGGYWQFNGNTTNSAIISTAQVANSQSSFSQSVWFQTSTANGIMTMLQNNISPAISGSLLNGLVVNATGRLSFYTYLTVAFPAQGNIATANVLDNKWHHAAVTYDSVTKTANTYLDGQLGNTLALGGANNIVFYSGYYAIGGASQGIAAGVGNAFRGNIGPVAIYSSPLTEAQVTSIYNSQLLRFQVVANNQANFSYTGSVQTFTVPPYVTELTARVVGAAGGTGLTLAGASSTSLGGAGANISATLAVTPGQTLFLVVGQGGFSNVQTAGTISQGGGGAAGPYYAGTGQNPGSSGGGFTGIFTADPSTAANATAAQATAMLIAGGGGGGTGGGIVLLSGGNASSTLSGNSSAGRGSAGTGSTAALQGIANVISNGTTVTINLSGGAAGNAVNFSIGCPVGVGGGTFPSGFIGNVRTANLTAITAIYGAGAPTPAAGNYTGNHVYAGGYNGANVQPYNGQGGGWATHTERGWQGVVSPIAYANNSARTMPAAGSALAGGTGGAGNQIFSNAITGAGGGGGWYGGGGGAFGSTAALSGAAGSGGGGSNYANSQIVIANTVSYGTLTNNTGVTRINGNIFLSW